MNKIIKSHHFLASIFSIGVFLFSSIISPYYVGGDQINYRLFYDSIAFGDYSTKDAFDYYRNITGSAEYGYFFLVLFFSKLLDKDLFVALSNLLFSYLLFCFLVRLGVNRIVSVLFLFDYYVVVNYFAAERLRFGFIMLLISALVSGRLRYLFWLSAGFFHIQSLVLLVSKWFSDFVQEIRDVVHGRKIGGWGRYLFYGLMALCVFFLLGDHIGTKFNAYNESSKGVDELDKALVFSIATFFYAKNRKLEAFSMQLIVILGVFMLGSDRMTVFSCIVFLYFALSFRCGLNFGVFSYILYSFYKSYGFVYNIVEYGNGYFKF